MQSNVITSLFAQFFTSVYLSGSSKSFLIATVALCNFANFGSVAMQLSGIGELAPTQKKNLVRLGIKALICGTLTGYLSACIVGILGTAQ